MSAYFPRVASQLYMISGSRFGPFRNLIFLILGFDDLRGVSSARAKPQLCVYLVCNASYSVLH